MKIIFLAILASAVLQTSHGAASTHCSGWKLGTETIKQSANIDDSRRDILLQTAFKFLPNSSSSGDTMTIIQESGEEYANASLMTLLPSILIMVLLGLSCLPVWSVCGCCENCCCKKRKEHEGACLPCVIWIIWLAAFVFLIILIIAAQFSFKQFSEGVSQSVCDVDGSLGAIAKWFTSLATVVETLGTDISGFVGEGKTAVFKSVDSLEPTIDSVNTTLTSVLNNVLGSTAVITAAFAEYELESDIDLKIGELNKQLKNLNNKDGGGGGDYKSIIKDSKKQVDELVTGMQTQIAQFPAMITPMLKNASTSVSDIRRELFNTGSVDLEPIPVLLDNGLKKATLIDAVAAGTDAIQTLVVLIYTPVFIALPALFIGGLAIIGAFVKCRTNKAAATFGLCCSKCGCFLIWMGLFVTLFTSLAFLTSTMVYNDSCSVFADPIYVINYAKKSDPALFAQLTSQIPKVTSPKISTTRLLSLPSSSASPALRTVARPSRRPWVSTSGSWTVCWTRRPRPSTLATASTSASWTLSSTSRPRKSIASSHEPTATN